MSANKTAGWIENRIWFYTALYLFIGLLFIVKYPGRYGLNPWLIGLVYTMFVIAGTWLLQRRPAPGAGLSTPRLLLIVILLAVGLTVVMLQFDPEIIRNARHKLLNQSVGLLLDGSFPYDEPLAGFHSAFPFWFLIATPFYAIGETGLLQILGFLLGAIVLIRLDRPTAPAGIFALLASPAFVYEIVVRSGITANMILALGYLVLIDSLLSRNKNAPVFFLGLIGGLLLSTRGVVFFVFTAYLGYYMRNNPRSGFILLLGWLISFCLTILPFMLWDGAHFWANGPFAHQLALTRFSIWLIPPLAVCAFFIGRKAKTCAGVWEMVGVFLFFGVSATFCLAVITHGLAASIMENRFDFSYFCFALPFIVAGWLRALRPAAAGGSNKPTSRGGRCPPYFLAASLSNSLTVSSPCILRIARPG